MRSVFDLGTDDYVDSNLEFKVEQVKMEQKRPLRFASESKSLFQNRIIPYSKNGRVVEGRYLYEWEEWPFVSMINVAQDEGCTQHICDLGDFLNSSTIQDRSCARYLTNKGSKEVDCSFKDHPWPLAYKLVCISNWTNIVINFKPLTLVFFCDNDDSSEVDIDAGVHRFSLGIGPIAVPENLGIKPYDGDPWLYAGVSGFGILFVVTSLGCYTSCRIFKGLPFWCCQGCCRNRCTNELGDKEGSIGALIVASRASRSTMRRNPRIFRNEIVANAPPPDYATIF